MPLPVTTVTAPLVVPGITKAVVIPVVFATMIATVPFIVTLVAPERSKLLPVTVNSVPTGPLVGLNEILGEAVAAPLGSFAADPLPDLPQFARKAIVPMEMNRVNKAMSFIRPAVSKKLFRQAKRSLHNYSRYSANISIGLSSRS